MSIEQYIDTFYKSLPEDSFRKEIVLGQICWIPVLHINRTPMLLEADRIDPKEVYITKFKIRRLQETDFRKKEKLPIKSIHLRLTEELIVHKAKKRPAIAVCNSFTHESEIALLLESINREHLQDKCVLFIPIYSIETKEHKGGFPPEMVARIKSLMYNQFFYCPTFNPEGFNGGIARLDRPQIIIPANGSINRAVCNPSPFALTDEALGVLLAMLRSLFNSKEEELEALRELLLETL